MNLFFPFFFPMKPRLVVLNHPVTWTNPPHSSFESLLPPEGAIALPDLVAYIFNSIVFFSGGLRRRLEVTLTEHGAGGNGLSVQPEGDLRQYDGHDARKIRLNHKVANLPFQVEVRRHHHVFP